ncbi:MAG TPA: Ohr family peroxiredoxin [Atopostipes sp.]|jgi:peroxiredoxin, Ohr subfamily|nr:Ohr family peroxiredoxin [Atopostipes sp.]
MANYEKQYETTSVNTGGRKGKSYLEDGTYAVNITPPGSKREGANPEELFALGYSACFHAALEAVKEQENVENKSIVRHTVSYLHDPDDNLDIKLQVDIKVGFDGLDKEEGMKLVEKAHKICPYSRAIENGHIDVTLDVVPYEE